MCTSFLWLWAGPPGTVGPLGAKALRGAGGPFGGAGLPPNWKALRAPGRATAKLEGPSGAGQGCRQIGRPFGRRAGLPPSRYMTFYFTILCGFLCEKPVIGKERAVTRKPLASRTGPLRHGRGASLPASPCSFVRGHHVLEHSSRSRRADVVLHRPLALIPSSPGTTSLGPSGPSAVRTWCFTPSNPLFLRRRAPRPRAQ